MKRVVDFVFCSLLLCLLLPVFSVITLAIFLTMGSPVLFRQLRVGRGDKIFTMYKFRSMNNLNPACAAEFSEHQRITPLGRFLRKFSLDELPELFNVLRGEMSLVGPRPLLVEYLPLYNSFQRRRHEVLPGITGWAQVNGRNAISWEEKFELDVWYVDNRSLALDIQIIFMTILQLIRPRGINAEGSASMPKFEGTKT